jgi:hypothetical protein
MSSFFIFQCKVERFIPKREAAPLGPPSTKSVSAVGMGGEQAALAVQSDLSTETSSLGSSNGTSLG